LEAVHGKLCIVFDCRWYGNEQLNDPAGFGFGFPGAAGTKS
jgi:hypothetical protein